MKFEFCGLMVVPLSSLPQAFGTTMRQSVLRRSSPEGSILKFGAAWPVSTAHMDRRIPNRLLCNPPLSAREHRDVRVRTVAITSPGRCRWRSSPPGSPDQGCLSSRRPTLLNCGRHGLSRCQSAARSALRTRQQRAQKNWLDGMRSLLCHRCIDFFARPLAITIHRTCPRRHGLELT